MVPNEEKKLMKAVYLHQEQKKYKCFSNLTDTIIDSWWYLHIPHQGIDITFVNFQIFVCCWAAYNEHTLVGGYSLRLVPSTDI